MSALLVHAGRDGPRWKAAFERAAPELTVAAWPEPVDPQRVAYAACWRPPEDFFTPLTQLKAVFALAAGIDKLILRPDFPARVPLIRLTDAGMAEQIAEFALLGVLSWQRRLTDYRAQQARAEWKPLSPRQRNEVRVAVLGIGAIGAVVAQTLARFGYRVTGWSRSPKALDGVRGVHGDEALLPLLRESDVLVNVLPSTPQTRGLLDATRLAALPPGAFVVNASRGDQLDAEALLRLLDAGHLDGALLDVFAVEPLPENSPIWRHPRITLTPHVAGVTLPEPSVVQIVEKLRRFEAGLPVEGVVDLARAY